MVNMKKSTLLAFLVMALLIFTPGLQVSAAATISPALAENSTESVIAKYRELIPQEMRKQNIPGMTIAIVDNNQVVWSEGFGYTDLDRKTPVTVDTPFSIQSMSKSFTAAAVMLAVQDGLVDLDTPISTYLPDFHINSVFEERPEDKITLRHLLSHTAGFTHDAPVGNNNNLDPGTWQAHIDSISKTWLLFPVGTRYNYSNNDIDLAAHIVEVRAGMPFTQYVKTRLLDPLGMTHSTIDIDAIRAMPDRAIGHSVFSRQIPIIPIMGAGGMYTSAADMAKYLMFYLNLGTVNIGTGNTHQVIETELIKEMYNAQFPSSNDQGYGLGLGFYRSNDATDTLEISHGGGGFGFISNMAWFPQLKFGVVWMTNSSDHDLRSWLTDRIIGDYIDANRSTMASRAYQSQKFLRKYFSSQDPAVLYNESLAKLIQSMALPNSPADIARRRALTGFYTFDTWGRVSEVHRLGLKNGSLTLDGVVQTEVRPGLFFDASGEALDLRGAELYFHNLQVSKIPLGTVIFYEVFLGLCGLGCLVLLLWSPVSWVWSKIRRRERQSRPSWSTLATGVFIMLGALVGILMIGIIWMYPALLGLRRIILPTASLPAYQNIALNAPYILLALALIAAVFSGLGWKGKTPSGRWIEAGKIALLVVYALVVI